MQVNKINYHETIDKNKSPFIKNFIPGEHICIIKTATLKQCSSIFQKLHKNRHRLGIFESIQLVMKPQKVLSKDRPESATSQMQVALCKPKRNGTGNIQKGEKNIKDTLLQINNTRGCSIAYKKVQIPRSLCPVWWRYSYK